MDFFAIKLFVILYHLRPHEWIGAVQSLRPAMLSMLIGLWGTANRDKGFSLSLLWKTPHDWLMWAYFAWIVVSSPAPWSTFQNCYSLFIYYFVIVLGLSSVERMKGFMRWWIIMLLVVASLALASKFGFDPTYSMDITDGRMKGRMVLNVSIFDNPNALGHSLVPALGIIYLLYFWNRFFTVRTLLFPMWGILGWCLFETESKGAFLSAFATVLAAVSFRRPLFIKVVIFVVASTIGWAAVKSLPRMSELEKPTAEGGIQGRLWVFRWGYETYNRTFTGVGWLRFQEGFAESSGFQKAPHSTYVAVGAELGKPGLFLLVGILYACYRTLLTARTRDEEEERMRRVFFVLLLSFTVSSWMVGWSYRASFFMMVAAIAAFQRQLMNMNLEPLAAGGPIQPSLKPAQSDSPRRNVIESKEVGKLPSTTPVVAGGAVTKAGTANEIPQPGILWNSLGWKDLLIILVATRLTVYFWGYILKNM